MLLRQLLSWSELEHIDLTGHPGTRVPPKKAKRRRTGDRQAGRSSSFRSVELFSAVHRSLHASTGTRVHVYGPSENEAQFN
eukprot:236257-Rhodomonas_salina.1